MAVIHTVQDDQGKGEEAKPHPGPLGRAGSLLRRRRAGRAEGAAAAAGASRASRCPESAPRTRGAFQHRPCAARRERGGKRGRGSARLSGPPLSPALLGKKQNEEKKQKSSVRAAGASGASERSHREPQLFSPALPRAQPPDPRAPGRAVSLASRYLSRREGAPRPHALRSQHGGAGAASPTFGGAAPQPARPVGGAAEPLGSAGLPPAPGNFGCVRVIHSPVLCGRKRNTPFSEFVHRKELQLMKA